MNEPQTVTLEISGSMPEVTIGTLWLAHMTGNLTDLALALAGEKVKVALALRALQARDELRERLKNV